MFGVKQYFKKLLSVVNLFLVLHFFTFFLVLRIACFYCSTKKLVHRNGFGIWQGFNCFLRSVVRYGIYQKKNVSKRVTDTRLNIKCSKQYNCRYKSMYVHLQ